MRNLPIEAKIAIFRTIAISKIVFQSFTITVPKHVVSDLEKLQKAFSWKNSTPKIMHETLYNDDKDEGLKNVNIQTKL